MQSKTIFNKKEKQKSDVTKKLLYLGKLLDVMPSSSDDVHQQQEKLMSLRIHKAIEALNPIEQRILLSEYNKNKEESKWYLTYFSRSTYYKRRKEAINKFLEKVFAYDCWSS